MKKKIFYHVITVIILCIFIIPTAFAGEPGAYVNFGNNGINQNMNATSKNAVTKTINGISCWKVPITGMYYINCAIDNTYIYNIQGNSSIVVKYFDDASGFFCVQYSTSTGNAYSETVNLTGSNSWKTHTFRLSDCVYNDGMLGNDFRITLQDAKGRSNSDVAFASVSVGIQSIFTEISSTKPGNVFISNAPIVFNMQIQDTLSIDKNCEVTTIVYDVDKNILSQKNFPILINSNSITKKDISLDALKNGLYSVKFIIACGAESYEFTENFSVVEAITKNDANSIFGTCLHISEQLKGSEKLNSMATMLKQSGIQWIRDEYYWDIVEQKKGVYTFYADDYIDTCVENGINPLVVLSYSNSLYGGVPHDAQGYAGFANYAKALATHLKGKVKTFEVWNEWNGGTWNDGYGILEYANILQATYTALKEVDPEIKIVAGASITAAVGWFDELFSTTIDGKKTFEYCDAISYHPYGFPASADAKKESGNIENNFSNMYNMMKKYGTPKPQWITEVGWFTGDDPRHVDPETQAAYITRAYISGMAYGVEKIFCYDFKDDGTDLGNSENNYGIIHSWGETEPLKYAAKPAYLATATVSERLKNSEFVKEFRPKENIRIYKFFNKLENKEIYAMYTSDDSIIDFRFLGNNLKLKCYDIYGNSCKIQSLSGLPIYIECNVNGFDLSEVITEFRLNATATFGENFKYDGIQVVGLENPISIGARNAYQINSVDNNILCDIDDSWVYSKNKKIKISVDYYDSGNGSFYIGYKNSAGNLMKSEQIACGSSGVWKTADFIINDADFTNSYNDGDFKIMSDNVSGNISFLAVRVRNVNSGTPVMTADFNNSDFKGLNQADAPAGYTVKFDEMSITALDNASHKFAYVEKNGRGGVYVPAVNNGYYLQVDIDDGILYGGINDITVDVDYFDEGKGNFDIAYDKGVYSFMYPTENVIYLQDTKTWKTAKFNIKKAWLENHGADLRVALWTGWMDTSTQGITFGGIKIYNNKEIPSFNIKYNEVTDNVNISGYYSKRNDSPKPVTLQILQVGKTSNDVNTFSNVNDVIRYFGEIPTKDVGDYKYYEDSFEMLDKTGAYLARVFLPDLNTVTEKYLYYYKMYDVDNLIIRDNIGNVLNKDQISGIDFFNISTDFTSNFDNVNVCMAVAVYDENNRMVNVELVSQDAVVGETKTMKASISLVSKIKKGYKIKLLMLKDAALIIPFSRSQTISIK